MTAASDGVALRERAVMPLHSPHGQRSSPEHFRQGTRPLELAVVIPVLNEAANVRPLLAALAVALADLSWEAIFVDDGSMDGTIDLIDEIARGDRSVRAIKRIGRTGLASAVLEGAMSSAAPVVAVIDGDLQHDERLLPYMYDDIADGKADMVVASRYIGGGGAHGLSAGRLRGSLAVTRLTNILLRTGSSDPMSGFFAIRRAELVELCPCLSAIGFKIALDILASGRGRLVVTERPLQFRTRQHGESKMDVGVLVDLLTFLIEKTVGRILPTRFILFLMVGSLGLVVHLGLLKAMLAAGQDFRASQSVAVLTAIAFNFTLNNAVTYARERLRGWRFARGMASFYLVCGTGALANIGIGTLLFAEHRSWWLAGMAGAVIGSVWNYAASSLLTWKTR